MRIYWWDRYCGVVGSQSPDACPKCKSPMCYIIDNPEPEMCWDRICRKCCEICSSKAIRDFSDTSRIMSLKVRIVDNVKH